MTNPDALDRVTCPRSVRQSKHAPERTWEGKTPRGKPIRYGVIGKHSHGYSMGECDYSGHVVPVERLKQSELTDNDIAAANHALDVVDQQEEAARIFSRMKSLFRG